MGDQFLYLPLSPYISQGEVGDQFLYLPLSPHISQGEVGDQFFIVKEGEVSTLYLPISPYISLYLPATCVTTCARRRTVKFS